jgi:hypothetical protein
VAVTTPAGHARIMQDLSPLLSPIYGKGPKDSGSLVASIITEQTLDAHRRVYRGAVNDMMERLPQDLRDVIRKANP